MNTAIFTIVAKNYLAYAKTLCNSIQEKHPEVCIFIVLADTFQDSNCSFKDVYPFELIFSEQLGIPFFSSFSFKYDVVEFATAIKPYAMHFIFSNYTVDKLIYLDPDIHIFQRLDYILSLLEKHSIVLTPHITKSFPNDGKGMIDRHILLAGLYNLGFIGISRTKITDLFLTWWKEKLYDECLMDSANALCVDQKWIDFVPLMFKDVYVIFHPGYNVAYWNLHERQVIFKDGVWHCNDQLLFFYHFSGIQVDNLDLLSKYQNRYNLSNYPELRKMFIFYKDLLVSNNYAKYSHETYSYNFFTDGSRIKSGDRKHYYLLGAKRHTIVDDPFDKSRYMIWKSKAIVSSIKTKLKFLKSKINLILK
ncbi:glycosyl transferase [Synechocystis salina LEGE 06155]|nr:glycosyl transferase [Synechocystis salina LEGE 06155]